MRREEVADAAEGEDKGLSRVEEEEGIESTPARVPQPTFEDDCIRWSDDSEGEKERTSCRVKRA